VNFVLVNIRTKEPTLGLKENIGQFSLLVLVNAFVGGMLGLERGILPKIAQQEFNITNHSVILLFIVFFGTSKAIANYFTGKLSEIWGRKNVLIIGWIISLPIPYMIIYANHWNWILLANIFLGIQQGFTWSSTVNMKIDLVGQKNRGFAMGINESVGYMSVGIFAIISGYVASSFGLLPYPFYVGIALSLIGLFTSTFLVKDTGQYVQQESATSIIPKTNGSLFHQTTWKDARLSSITQAGFINNLNDGMMWGLLPIFLVSRGVNTSEMSELIAIYPMVWGISQIATGRLGDFSSKKKILFWGMMLQGIAVYSFLYCYTKFSWILVSILLGLGTALVYPNFMSAIAENTHPHQRATSIGIFRLWRDLGYAFGAILAGIISDLIGLELAFIVAAILTALSALIIQFRMPTQ